MQTDINDVELTQTWMKFNEQLAESAAINKRIADLMAPMGTLGPTPIDSPEICDQWKDVMLLFASLSKSAEQLAKTSDAIAFQMYCRQMLVTVPSQTLQ